MHVYGVAASISGSNPDDLGSSPSRRADSINLKINKKVLK